MFSTGAVKHLKQAKFIRRLIQLTVLEADNPIYSSLSDLLRARWHHGGRQGEGRIMS